MKKNIYIKRYEIVKNKDNFYVKDYDGRGGKEYLLKATTWEEANIEAKELKEKLKVVYPNNIIVIE